MDTELSFESICAAAGSELPPTTRPLVAPIYQASVFQLDSLEQVDELYSGEEPGYVYTREGNPNTTILTDTVARLEAAEGAVAFPSGMSAIAVTFLSLLESGDRILAASELYGATHQLLTAYLPRFGITTEFVDVTDLGAVAAALETSPKLIFVESISNPLLKVTDVEAVAQMADDRGVTLIVDNTFATPVLMRPMTLGADAVVHSMTKALCGHSDVTGGLVAAGPEIVDLVGASAQVWGATPDPFAAWLAVRGMRTLPLRVREASANAAKLARYLSEHPKIDTVHYPGLQDHPHHGIAARLFNGLYGSMVSFELAGGLSAASGFVRHLKLVRFAASLGEVVTTILHPVKMSHRRLTPAQREDLGIRDGLVRMSCGIESADDLIADLDQALAKL